MSVLTINTRWNDEAEAGTFESMPMPCSSTELELSYMLPQLLAPAEFAGGSGSAGFFRKVIDAGKRVLAKV